MRRFAATYPDNKDAINRPAPHAFRDDYANAGLQDGHRSECSGQRQYWRRGQSRHLLDSRYCLFPANIVGKA